jgi:hypothetical protein
MGGTGKRAFGKELGVCDLTCCWREDARLVEYQMFRLI